jgi:hypothetical protein
MLFALEAVICLPPGIRILKIQRRPNRTRIQMCNLGEGHGRGAGYLGTGAWPDIQ